MQTKFTRRSLLAAGASMLALGALPHAQAQAKTKLRFSSAFTEQDLRADAYKAFARGDQGRLRLRALLGEHAVQAGHRAHRHAARQSRNGQSRAGGYLEADSRVVADDLGLSVSRRRAPEEDLQERRRPRIHQDGARPARHPDHHAGLLRIAQRQPEARPPDQDAGRHGWNQAADAARRVLAVSRRIDRRQSDARRVRRGLHGVAVGRHRRPGQSAGREQADEVLRGDDAIRPDRPRHRLRRDDHQRPRSGTR